jgi:hypothetical protein
MNRRPAIEFARISTMPRPNTEARGYLDGYQLAIEKARLEKELDLLEIRRSQIHRRLQQVSHSLEDINHNLPLAESQSQSTRPISDITQVSPQVSPQVSTSTDAYQTFLLEF